MEDNNALDADVPINVPTDSTINLPVIDSKSDSKVTQYGLEEEVLRLYFEGFKPYKISKHCNALLLKEGKPHIPLNTTNIIRFLKRKNLEYELATDTSQTALVKTTIDIDEKLNNLVNILESDLDKLRSTDGEINIVAQEFYIRIIREMRNTLELIAGVKGKLQPSINFAIFNQTIEGFVKQVTLSEKLTPESKRVVIEMAADSLCNTDILKPTKGMEIK